MKICEIFSSIQGESTYAGLPCTFVRLSGCNLRCSYCDTQHAYEGGSELTVDEVLRAVRQSGIELVEITGGEPLLQTESRVLTLRLLEEGYRVLIETNGSISTHDVDQRAVTILDVKTPGSGESGRMDFSNLDRLRPSDQVKFVVCGREDYEWSKGVMRDHGLGRRCVVLLSPADGFMSAESLARWMTDDRLQARLNMQIHKYVFGPDRRGV